MPARTAIMLGLAVLASAGCGADGSQPAFPDLHPVKGVVTRSGQPVRGGVIVFTPEPPRPEFLINSSVGADGTYELSTVRTTDTRGERRPGAPAGTYRVTYEPPLGEQTAEGHINPITLRGQATVQAGDNDVPISLPPR